MAEDLRPPALGLFGFAAALRAFSSRFTSRHLSIEVALDSDGQRIAEPVRLALFRVAQESIANVAKHAAPTRISVTLCLADNGVGYAVAADLVVPSEPGHYGLVGIAERSEAVGATLTLDSQSGGGTRVRVWAPFHHDPRPPICVLLAAVRADGVDVAVFDMEMPRMTGVEVA